MSSPAAQAELMRSLGRLVRGLSALFWGLPLALVVSVQTARTNVFAPLGVFPPLVANGVVLFGLLQLAHFQRQERVWRDTVERAKLLALANVGLSPFLYWWKVLPAVAHYRLAVALLALCGLMLLANLNRVLERLTAMLPDEALRVEARTFTSLNLYLVLAILVLATVWIAVGQLPSLPGWLLPLLPVLARTSIVVLLLLVLMPVAMTMALIWKIKEVIIAGVFT